VLEIGYLEIEAIITAMSGVSDRGMIRRRFKYLQRMSYPPNTNTGRGRRALLDLEQLLQVIVAVELMQVGASPTRAIRILRTNWDELRPALALGWLVSRKPGLAPLRDLLVMNAGAFEDTGKSEDPHEPVAQPFRAQPAVDLLIGLMREGTTTRVVLDPARLATHLIDYAKAEGAGFTVDDLDASYANLWSAVLDVEPDEWIEAAVREDRLGSIERSMGQSFKGSQIPAS
jgi:hypothetical protein